MKRNHFPKYSKDDKISAVIGWIARNDGVAKTTASAYNRQAKQFHLPHMNAYEIMGFENDLIYQKNLHDKDGDSYGNQYLLFRNVKNGKIKLQDVVGSNYSDKEFQQKVSSGYDPAVENHQWALDQNRQFRGMRRWRTRMSNSINSVLDGLSHNLVKTLSTKSYTPANAKTNPKHQKTMFVTLADTHIGCYVDIQDKEFKNNYSVSIFKHRFSYYISRCVKIAKEQHITRIILVNIGDQIEGLNMRWNQAFTTEIDLSDQVNLAVSYMIKAIKVLSHIAPTTVLVIQGNHDRCTPKQADNNYGDSYSRIELNFLIKLNKLGVFHNVKIINNLDEIHSGYLTVYHKHYLFVHGDDFGIKQNKPNISHLETAGRPIDYLVYGHFHCFKDIGVNGGKQQIQVPSMEGHNRFSKRLGMAASNAGQVILMAEPHMPVVPIQVDLSHIQM